MKLLLLSLATMRAAMQHHDPDEAARQGMLSGPAVVAQALRDPDRLTRLAGIAAAPRVEDRYELLRDLARVAGGPDRRTAIPAAEAALQIARDLAKHPQDDLADDDLARWHDAWLAIADRGDRWIEVRIKAIDVAAALGEVPLSTDPDPAVRLATVEVTHAPLADVVDKDVDDKVALAAAKIMCSDGVPLTPAGAARMKALKLTCH